MLKAGDRPTYSEKPFLRGGFLCVRGCVLSWDLYNEGMETNEMSHPWQVGRMVYETLEEAIAKAAIAAVIYDQEVKVINRRTNGIMTTVIPRKAKE